MAELSVFGVAVAAADSELRYVGDGKTPVCTVNLAFNRSWKNRKTDEWEKETCFMRGQVWGTRAEKLAEVKSGQPIYVTGYVKLEKWEKDGQKRTSHSLAIRDFQLVEKNGHKKSDVPAKPETSQPKSEPEPQSVPVSTVGDDDGIPF